MEFTFYNPSGQLTLSGDGITYSYVGRATLSSVSQAGGNTTSKGSGGSTYTVNWAGDVLVALPVKSNGTTALTNLTRSGDTWTIVVHKGNGSFDADGFDVQEATEVYVFGAPAANATSTFMLYDINGVPCADLSRRPLTYKERISMSASTLEWAASIGAATPAIIGWPQDYNVTSASAAPSFINRTFARGWQLSNTGTVLRNTFLTRWVREDGGATPVDTIRPIDAMLIEVAGLT